ncbi:MAG: cytochrome P450 [Halioglobus sp.]|nr:cytochrome P450 [Halioglobus sp.]
MTNTDATAVSGSPPYYDPYDFDIDQNPYPCFKQLRDHAPLYYNEKYDFYALSRYQDVLGASKDWQTFSSARGTVLELLDLPAEHIPQMMIFMDPPQHDRMRRLVSRGFSPRHINRLEQRTRELARELLAPFQPGDTLDLIDDYAAPFASMVIGELAGVPREDLDIVRQWGEDNLALKEGEDAFQGAKTMAADADSELAAARRDVWAYFNELIEKRRREPQDDMISAVIASEIEGDGGGGRPLEDRELLDFIGLLSGAGTETVSRLMGWAGVYLPEHADQFAAIRGDLALLPGAIEELLRIEPPSPVQARITTASATFYGTEIPAGSKLLLLTGAAGRDERQYHDPDRFDIRRDAKHVSLGQGVHFCLGANLARLEARVALEELIARFPTWEPDIATAQRIHTSTVRGYRHLPVRL